MSDNVDLDKLRGLAEQDVESGTHWSMIELTNHIDGEVVLRMLDERAEALDSFAKVEALHQPYTKSTVRLGSYTMCDDCGAEWPCATVRALRGDCDDE